MMTGYGELGQPWPHSVGIDGVVAVWYSDTIGASWQLADVACSSVQLCNSSARVFTGHLTESVLAELPGREGGVILSSRVDGAHLRRTAICDSPSNGRPLFDATKARKGSFLPDATGCAGGLVKSAGSLFYSNAIATDRSRRNMTVMRSDDRSRTWSHGVVIHQGPAAYSTLCTTRNSSEVGIAYERPWNDSTHAWSDSPCLPSIWWQAVPTALPHFRPPPLNGHTKLLRELTVQPPATRATYCNSVAVAGLLFSPPVLLGPLGGSGKGVAESANESKTDGFFGFGSGSEHMVGVYGQSPPIGAGSKMPVLHSSDGVRSFQFAFNLSDCMSTMADDDGYGKCWEGPLIAPLDGHGQSLFSLGAVRPPLVPGRGVSPVAPPWRNFSADVITVFNVSAVGRLGFAGRVEQHVEFSGLPFGTHPGCNRHPWGLSLYASSAVRLPRSGVLVHTAIVCWKNIAHRPRYSVLAFRSNPGNDFAFRYAGVIADATMLPPYSVLGPSEHDITVLANNSLLAVLRYDGNGGCGTIVEHDPAPFTSTGYTYFYSS
eukprot:SAG22_NODE_1898_length_3346_cov_6.935017_3_plen_544_part_01